MNEKQKQYEEWLGTESGSSYKRNEAVMIDIAVQLTRIADALENK